MQTPEIICAGCNVSMVPLDEIDLEDFADDAEQWDAIENALPTIGWSVRKNDEGNREALCPKCIEATKPRHRPVLVRYDPANACPKCGHDKSTDRFVRGMEFGRLQKMQGIEHIERTCGRCGFRWPEAPLSSADHPPFDVNEDTRMRLDKLIEKAIETHDLVEGRGMHEAGVSLGVLVGLDLAWDAISGTRNRRITEAMASSRTMTAVLKDGVKKESGNPVYANEIEPEPEQEKENEE